MAHVVPSLSDFRARHTSFSTVADATVEAMLTEASSYVSECWSETDYGPAILYLAAHMISEEQSAGGATAASKAGPIKRVKADTVEIEYMGGSMSDAALEGTVYGRRFLMLRRRNVPAVLVV